jgi:hypothetical protein
VAEVTAAMVAMADKFHPVEEYCPAGESVTARGGLNLARNEVTVKMISTLRILRGILWSILVGGVAFGQSAPRIAPVPRDPLELASEQIQGLGASPNRQTILQLLGRARGNFALRSAGQAYDLKVSFTVDSQGQTNYDGFWEMEDLFVPEQGHRWTAKAASGYTITAISSAGKTYAEGTANAIPLRLFEARGLLFDPIQSPAYANRGSIRMSTASFHAAMVICALLSRSPETANAAAGRGWDESEECIDPQSGLLQVHSEVPGRYAVYDYSNAPQLAGHMLPRSVTVTEGGRVVSKISVESLREMNSFDPSLFVPTDGMRAAGPVAAMTYARKVSHVPAQSSITPALTLRPVCVFGMVTSTGQLVEAHSLQPSDPNSQAAVEDAKRIDFSPLTAAGVAPKQHFVFVIEKFPSQQ